MKHINILSLIQAYSSLQNESYSNFLRHYGIGIKNEEILDLTSFVDILRSHEKEKYIFNQFYVGYKIPQIGKEFDLLRFGKDCIINIELKNTATKDKIEIQLKRNKYYLSFIGKKIYSFSFISSTGELFCLDDNNQIISTDFLQLAALLKNLQCNNIKNIDNLFTPSDYLVSPFNSTEKFINDEYFLTHQQEEIEIKILNTITNATTASFISIKGSAGTGKTLLVYDIAKKVMGANLTPIIIHCGSLNDGQLELISKHNWNITSIKNYNNYDLAKFDVVIIDEAQRIYPEQLDKIVNKIQAINGKCIFSYDKLQTLASWEEQRNIDDRINTIQSIATYKLTEKIRTNKEIASFIQALFSIKSATTLTRIDNIELSFFNNTEDARDYLKTLNNQEWNILRFTPSQYNNEHHMKYSDISNETSHKVIGQEFDGVVITMDKFFSYDDSGNLTYNGNAYYDPVKMLFQNITRTRKRLNIVIIDNSTLLDRCVSVLKH